MYNSFISINKKFKSSVNLQYDLYNTEKILQYIPTTDLCDVLKFYIKSVLSDSCRASLLAGPYGKGKSYLMLMLSYLISKKKNKDVYNSVLRKIRSVDHDLYDLLNEVDKKKICLLPVIISNNNFDDFNQSFMLSLRNALIEHDINDIVPSTAFSEALELLRTWEENATNNFDILNKCLETLNIGLAELRSGLLNFDLSYYTMFENLYRCVTYGCKFNPLTSSDISLVYADVAKKIEAYGYAGIFVIYDEFGVFLESHLDDFASRLNKIQSFAEKASSSSTNGQLHLCCIAHKDISLYCKDKNQLSEFEKISGRFKQIRFDRSLDENYQIICSAIEKKREYNNAVSLAKEKNGEFFSNILQTNIFTSKEQAEYIVNNGFPFNPISLYVLIQISEKVAQNERTLFTFISDSDINSFNYFIHNNSSGFLNVPVVYDYFENLIKDNEEYKMLYYKVEALKKLSVKEEEHNIFKVIATVKLINDSMKFNATIENIALSLNKTIKEVKTTIQSLIDRNILKENINDHSIDFAVIADEEINKLLEATVASQFATSEIDDLLTELNDEKYYVSNKYNFETCMIRYYKVIYLKSSKLQALHSVDVLLNDESDGLIINLINDNNIGLNDLKKTIAKFNKSNLIIRFLKGDIVHNIEDKARKVFAAKYMIKENKNLTETVKNSLPLLIDDLTSEIKNYLTSAFNAAKSYCVVNYLINDLKSCIYVSLKKTYYQTVKLNNEQVNKNVISAVTLKSRNTVIQAIFSNQPQNFGVTSAEATILQSFYDSINGNFDVITTLKNLFLQSGNNGLNASKIVDLLHNAPFGMRNGIIPLFVAYTISLLSIVNDKSIETVLLYNDAKEIELNAYTLSKALADPNRYVFVYAQINKEKLQMTNLLLSKFDCLQGHSFNENIACLVKSIKIAISNLAPVVLKSTNQDNILDLSEEALQFKDVFMKHDLNNYKVLFEDLPKLFKCDYINIANKVDNILNEYQIKLRTLNEDTIIKLKGLFLTGTDSIKTSYNTWKMAYPFISNIVFDGLDKKIYQALEKSQYNDFDATNLVSVAITGCSIDEWTKAKQALFYKSIDNFKNTVITYNPSSISIKKDYDEAKDETLSSLARTLYTNMLDSLDEYGSALTNEEKAKVLKKLLYDILN